MKTTLIALLVLGCAIGCQTAPKGINQTSKVKIGTPIWEFETGHFMYSSPAHEELSEDPIQHCQWQVVV